MTSRNRIVPGAHAEARRPRHQAQARRGRPLHARQGQLCRRFQIPRACCSAISSARPMAMPASRSINKAAALKLPGVKAVLTAEI